MTKYAYCKICDREVSNPVRKPMKSFQAMLFIILVFFTFGIALIIIMIINANKAKEYCPTCRTKVGFSSEPYKKPEGGTEPLTPRESILKKKMSEDYIFNKNLKCRDCRKKFRSKSKIRICPVCGSGNIRVRGSNGLWCECVCTLIIAPLIIFFALLGIM